MLWIVNLDTRDAEGLYKAPPWRATTLAFNRARLAFAHGDWEKAHRLLQQTDPNDPIDNVNARVLQLKIYRETNEFTLFDALLPSSEHYVRRQAENYHQTLWRGI